jgi:AmiR/NasT family two-component response regulator
MAIGVTMTLYRCTDEQAFGHLRGASQQTHQKSRDVAEEVILTGQLPAATPRLST